MTHYITNPSILSMLLYRRSPTMPDPWYIQVEPSRNCNLSCPHCVKSPERGLMEYDTFKRIILGSKNVEYVKLQGLGEPLLNPDLAAMARYAKANGCRTEVISNGTIPPSSELMDAIDTYVISMETCDPKSYRKIRGTDIDSAINTLEILRLYFKGRIGINCVLTGDTTVGDVAELEAFAKRYNATVTTPMMQNWLSPGIPGYEEMQQKISAALWAHPGKFGLADTSRETFCQWNFSQAYYDYLGRLHPCCIRMSACYDLGKEWNGKIMQTFRSERRFHSFCKNCPL